MAWYTHYLQFYNHSLTEIPEEQVEVLRHRLASLQSNSPLVTVSVIAYNEEKRLFACLSSLSEMVCRHPIEIIGVNNNSSDRTEDLFRLVGIPYYNESRKSCGYARQCGLDHARGKYHLNIDSDTLYPPHYVETMVSALEKPGVVAAQALWSYIPDEQHSRLSLWVYEALRDVYLWMQSYKRPELSVRGLVFAYRTEEARKEGIRVELKRGEDGSLALALKKYGRIVFVRNRKARAVTGYGTVSADGSFLNSFRIRMLKGLRQLPGLFFKKKQYEDDPANLLN